MDPESQCRDILISVEESVYLQRQMAHKLLKDYHHLRLDSGKPPMDNAAESILQVSIEAGHKRLGILSNNDFLSEIQAICKNASIARSVTDRPFEIFWFDKQKEPKHTKLLTYFIDPAEQHGYAKVLLKLLFDSLDIDEELPAYNNFEGFEVKPEAYTRWENDLNGRIDILITYEFKQDKRYAVVLENKVRGAGDTEAQLWKYVMDLESRGFQKIYVRYLPLRSSKPSENSLGVGREPGDIRDSKEHPRVSFDVKTFEKAIFEWLSAACSQESIRDEGEDEPEKLGGSMRDNLRHYKNLIQFLVNRDKINTMDNQIIIALKHAGENAPTFEGVRSLLESATNLADSYPYYIRAKLLCEMRNNLLKKELDATLFINSARGPDGDGNMRISESDDDLFTTAWCAVGIPIHIADSVYVAVMTIECPDRGVLQVQFGLRTEKTARDKLLWLSIPPKDGFYPGDGVESPVWYQWTADEQLKFGCDELQSKLVSLEKRLMQYHTEMRLFLEEYFNKH